MLRRIKVRQLVVLALSFAYALLFVRPVCAGFPVVSNVIVWENDANTVLNVTVTHSPQTTLHYLDRVEVNVNGDNRIFPVAYRSETTFVVQCDLGIVDPQTNATIRAHCIIDGYSLSLYGPMPVPEFSSVLFLPLSMIAVLLAVIVWRGRTIWRKNQISK